MGYLVLFILFGVSFVEFVALVLHFDDLVVGESAHCPPGLNIFRFDVAPTTGLTSGFLCWHDRVTPFIWLHQDIRGQIELGDQQRQHSQACL